MNPNRFLPRHFVKNKNVCDLKRTDTKHCTVNLTSRKTIGELVVEKIINHNGKGSRIYGVPGAGWYLEDQYIQNAIDQGNLIYHNMTDETSAVFAAAYDSEVTENPQPGQIGVAFTTAGPGVACAVNGIANASTETKSVVIFCGYANNSNFQFIDENLIKPITRKVYRLRENTVNPGQIIEDAFFIAKYGTTESPCRGPVVLLVDQTAWRLPYISPSKNMKAVTDKYSPQIISMMKDMPKGEKGTKSYNDTFYLSIFGGDWYCDFGED